MISGVSRMDSEWWKTPRFIYGQVLGSLGKFWVKPRKVRNILEGGGTGPAGPAPPRRGAPGLAGQASRVGEGVPPSLHASWRGRGVPPPHSFRCVLFPFLFGKLEFELVWTRDLISLRNLRPHVSRAFIYETSGQSKTHKKPAAPASPPAPAPPDTPSRHRSPPLAAAAHRSRSPASRWPSSVPGVHPLPLRDHAVDLRISPVIAGFSPEL